MLEDEKGTPAERAKVRNIVLRDIEQSENYSHRFLILTLFVPSVLIFFIGLISTGTRRLTAGVVLFLALSTGLSYFIVRMAFGQPSLGLVASYRYGSTLLAASAVISFTCAMSALLSRKR